MRGSIVKRKGCKTYSIVISQKDEGGKWRQKWLSTGARTKKEAQASLTAVLHKINTGVYVPPSKLTLSQFLEHWLQDCRGNIAPNTAQTYAWFIDRHIKPAIGQIALTTLKPEHLQRLYSEKLSSGRRDGTGGLGSRSVRYIHSTLHKALKSAVKLGMIARNPADLVDIPKVTRHEMQVMNETDLHIFLEYAKSTRYYPLFYVALFTGMRRSELLALRWCDIDLLLCQASVTRTLHQLHNREFVVRQPKTAKGRRLIALSPSTVQVLREHREAQEKLRQSLDMTLSDDDLVFCKIDGKPLLPDSITQAWRNLARRTGLKGIRLHDARHSHASLMLKQGIHPKIVSERLGHATIAITLDTYSHVVPGLQEAAALRFDEALTSTPRKELVENIR
ncbi:tyrosine-type recombinase/integrase [Chloroflexota bacterium]